MRFLTVFSHNDLIFIVYRIVMQTEYYTIKYSVWSCLHLHTKGFSMMLQCLVNLWLATVCVLEKFYTWKHIYTSIFTIYCMYATDRSVCKPLDRSKTNCGFCVSRKETLESFSNTERYQRKRGFDKIPNSISEPNMILLLMTMAI